MSYHCPKCDGITSVVETRAEIRRRRCKACGYVFLTEEVELERTFTKSPFTAKREMYHQRKEENTNDRLAAR